jgi:hypothetical protein
MCIALIEKEDPKEDQKKDDQRFPGDTEGYRKWEEDYYNKHGHVPDYNGEP